MTFCVHALWSRRKREREREREMRTGAERERESVCVFDGKMCDVIKRHVRATLLERRAQKDESYFNDDEAILRARDEDRERSFPRREE